MRLRPETTMQIEDADKARRLARTIVSDIALYNRDEIRKGIRDDNIFDLLAEEIERGRKLYVSRVSAEIQRRVNYYNQALVDILIKQYGTSIESSIW
ncbi:MAG TPA: hypothetical protein VN317_03790 [Candidatus Methanoperedens sp.]|nr:hypothetical protein [Candidatus Methanoperedens sp.]